MPDEKHTLEPERRRYERYAGIGSGYRLRVG